jgi:acetyl esterase
VSIERSGTLFGTYEEAAAAVAAAGIVSASPLMLPLDEARAAQARYFAFLAQDPPEVRHVEDVAVAGPVGMVPLRLYYPEGAGPFPVILYIRGSGWWTGDLASHDRTMRVIARESGFAVCGVDYRRTPEFRCPVQRDEVLAALAFLEERAAPLGLAPGAIVLWGESAGATLSLSAAQAQRDARRTLPRGLVLMYGNFGGPKPESRDYSKWVWQQYLVDPAQAQDPAAVPLRGTMDGLPPVWLGCGDRDPLIADTNDLAGLLARAGVAHEVRVYPGMPHAFCMFTRFLEPAHQSIRDGAAAARRFVDTAA